MSSTGHFTRVATETADQFMEALSPLNAEPGAPYFPTNWYFRGLADARWALLPSVLRGQAMLVLGEWPTGPRENLSQEVLT